MKAAITERHADLVSRRMRQCHSKGASGSGPWRFCPFMMVREWSPRIQRCCHKSSRPSVPWLTPFHMHPAHWEPLTGGHQLATALGMTRHIEEYEIILNGLVIPKQNDRRLGEYLEYSRHGPWLTPLAMASRHRWGICALSALPTPSDNLSDVSQLVGLARSLEN